MVDAFIYLEFYGLQKIENHGNQFKKQNAFELQRAYLWRMAGYKQNFFRSTSLHSNISITFPIVVYTFRDLAHLGNMLITLA